MHKLGDRFLNKPHTDGIIKIVEINPYPQFNPDDHYIVEEVSTGKQCLITGLQLELWFSPYTTKLQKLIYNSE